jgi:Arc/MetJ-type ribon-helix-helix transcriptional regulator
VHFDSDELMRSRLITEGPAGGKGQSSADEVGPSPPVSLTAARSSRSMVVGMATKKVTITIDENQLERIRALVEAGTTSSVSGFVQHAVGVALDDVAGWGAMLADALRDTGGELSREERRWADEVLGVKGRAKGRPNGAAA